MNAAQPAAGKLLSLELLRAVAALLVVLFHTDLIFGTRAGVVVLGGAFAHGNRGVDLFFVLSGFIITCVHRRDWGHPSRLGSYLFNRAGRIYPSVWIVTALALAMYAAGGLLGVTFGFGGAGQAGRLDVWNVVASALLLPQQVAPLVNVTWTLKYEMLFYLFFALAIVDQRFLALLFAWQGAALAGALAGVDFGAGWLRFCLGPWCLEFGVGMACAWLVLYRGEVPVLGRRAVQIAGLLLGTAIFMGGTAAETAWGSGAAFSGLLSYGLGSGLIVASLALLELSGRLRLPTALGWLGGASYSIYLINFPVINLLSAELLRRHALPLNDAVYLAFAALGVAAGGAFHRCVDQPIQRALRRLKPHLLGTLPDTAVRRAATGGNRMSIRQSRPFRST